MSALKGLRFRSIVRCHRGVRRWSSIIKFACIFVVYKTWRWTPIVVRSFREQLPDCELIVIDNNPMRGSVDWIPYCGVEQNWIRSRRDLIVVENNSADRSAGRGIDLGLQICRERQHEVMIHIEPDCLVSGRKWLENLLIPMRHGAWMSGSLRRFYGPIHPTPSAWRTDVDWSSFAHDLRRGDSQHPLFPELFRLQELLEWATVHEPAAMDWWEHYWDCAQRNWFRAAAVGKAELVEPANDFEHFWYGSSRPPDPTDTRLARYLG